MKARDSLRAVAPRFGFVGRWLRKVLHLDRRWGVRYGGIGRADRPCYEKIGFYNRGEAERFLAERELVGVVFFYDPVDLRMPFANTLDGRVRQVL